MSALPNLLALSIVVVATVLIGVYGLRISRTTSDFYVASRSVSPWLNASAIGGEYLSAASFLGIAGLIFAFGPNGFWFPIGYTAGYLLLLLFVAAPLRRSGAYTVPDFTAARLESRAVRRVTSALVVLIGWLYVVPQLQGASLSLALAAGLPSWVGAVLVAVLVAALVSMGGMRSITFVQAFQYWLKLVAIAVPTTVVFFVALGQAPSQLEVPASFDLPDLASNALGTISLLVALLLGTMGLPHVLVRFYTNPDGQAARRTTVIVLVLLGLFYAFPTLLGMLGRAVRPDLIADEAATDSFVLLLPSAVIPGMAGQLLTAVVVAGAFAAFVSTSSGLVVSLAGVISQEFGRSNVRSFRLATLVSTAVPLGVALVLAPGNLAGSVSLVFALTAATVAPVLLLSVWWPRLTAPGAIAAMVTGVLGTGIALAGPALLSQMGLANSEVPSAVWQRPALVTVPLSFAVAIVVSLLTPSRRPRGTSQFLARIHSPEKVARRS